MASTENDAERIVRLETKLDFLIGTIDKLPPSPSCLAKDIDFERRITSLETWRNRAIGALLVINIVLVITMDKLRAIFFPT